MDKINSLFLLESILISIIDLGGFMPFTKHALSDHRSSILLSPAI